MNQNNRKLNEPFTEEWWLLLKIWIQKQIETAETQQGYFKTLGRIALMEREHYRARDFKAILTKMKHIEQEKP